MNEKSQELIKTELMKLYPNQQQTREILSQFIQNLENSLLIEAKYKIKDTIVQALYNSGIYSKENYSKQLCQLQSLFSNQNIAQQFKQILKSKKYKIQPQRALESRIQLDATNGPDAAKHILKLQTKRQNILNNLEKQLQK